MKKIFPLFFLVAMLLPLSASAIQITRYVSINGTGNGLAPETPTSNLGAMLALAPKVQSLEIRITPGIYQIPAADFDGSYGWPNVAIIGVDNFSDNAAPAQLPTIETNFLKLNGTNLVNIEVYGGLELRGSAYLKNVKVLGRISHTIDGSAEYKNLECKGILFNGIGSNAMAHLGNVTSDGCRQYGLEAHNVQIYAIGCSFNNNKRGGARIENGRQSVFSNCNFFANGGEGACVIQEFREFMTSFISCNISQNTTDSPHYYGAGVTSMASSISCRNTIFSANHSNSSKIGGAIKTGAKFAVQNCWFDRNDAAINCGAYPNEAGLLDIPVVNTIFTGNSNELYTPNDYQIATFCCAMQQGSGIPEIDAQNGTIAIHPDLDGSIEGVKYAGIYKTETDRWALRENSPLINAGCEVSFLTDFYGANRCIYGKTDIGPFEFVSTITPDAPLNKVTVGGLPFYTATSTFGNEEYGFLILGESPVSVATGTQLYYGKKANGFKLFDLYAAIYTEDYGKNYCFFYEASNNYRNVATWFFKKSYPYSGKVKPTVKKLPGEKIKFSITQGTKTETYIP